MSVEQEWEVELENGNTFAILVEEGVVVKNQGTLEEYVVDELVLDYQRRTSMDFIFEKEDIPAIISLLQEVYGNTN